LETYKQRERERERERANTTQKVEKTNKHTHITEKKNTHTYPHRTTVYCHIT
jgi:hypothetical protein